MRKIAVIGSTNTDMVISGKRIPVPGETVSGGHFMMNPGVKATDAASAAKATAVLKKRGVRQVLIAMGVKGCFCGECGKIFPAKKVKAVDCVAAGDTFNGAFAVALAEGQPVADAMAFAQKASAISVTRPGAQSSIPCRKEVLATKDAKSAKAL